MWLLIILIGVPLIEIGLFIQVGGWLGLWPTLAIVVATAVLGAYMFKLQGRQALDNLRRSFSELSDPTEPLVHGAMILVSGALLVTPGFFTDAIGFALLIPGFRDAAYRYLRARVSVTTFTMGEEPRQQSRQQPRQPGQRPRPRHHPDIIEGEYTEVQPGPPNPSSKWRED